VEGGDGGGALAEVEGEEGVAVEGAERERAAEGEAVDGAREERVVGEDGEAGARERGDGRVRVGGERVERRGGGGGLWGRKGRRGMRWVEGKAWRGGRGEEAARGAARPRGGVAGAVAPGQFRVFFFSDREGRRNWSQFLVIWMDESWEEFGPSRPIRIRVACLKDYRGDPS
jgi:hypothetical protein